MKVQTHRVSVLELRGGVLPPHPSFKNDGSTLILVFAPAGNDFNNFDDIISYLQNYNNSFIAGCSGGGVIHESCIFDDEMIVVQMAMEWTRLHVTFVNLAASDSFSAGKQLAKTLSSPALSGMLVFSGGEITSGSALAAGINEVLKGSVPILGALAGKINPAEQWTWVLDGTKIIATSAVGIGFYGPALHMFSSTASGWEREGLWLEVTKAEGREILELNDRPALDVYSQYIGGLEAAALPVSAYRHPLAILPKIMAISANTCMVYDVDKGRRSLKVASEIVAGTTIQFMSADQKQLVAGIEDAAILMGAVEPDESGLALIMSSVGRRAVLGSEAVEELLVVSKYVPGAVGFYSIGEFGPHLTNDLNYRSQTAILAYLWEQEP